MRNLLALAAMGLLVFVGLGWYLGWYKVHNTTTTDGHREITIDLDTPKIKADVSKGETKLQDYLKDNNGQPIPGQQIPGQTQPQLPGLPPIPGQQSPIPGTSTSFTTPSGVSFPGGSVTFPGVTVTVPTPPTGIPRLPMPQ